MSNGTNLTQQLLDDFNKSSFEATKWQGWISLGVAVFQIPFLAWIEIGRPRHIPNVNWKLALSRLNISVLAISSFTAINNVFYYLSVETSDLGPQYVYNAISDTAGAIIYMSLFIYTYIRGTPIIKSLLPGWMKWIPLYQYLYLAVQVVQLALFILSPFFDFDTSDSLLTSGEEIGVAVVFLLQVFDMFVSFCYCKYLWNMSKNSLLVQDMEKSLVIIARIGLISNLLGFFWFISFLLLFFFDWSNDYSSFENASYLFIDGYLSLLPHIFVFLQLWMKFALRYQEWAESDQHNNRVGTGKAAAITAQEVTTSSKKKVSNLRVLKTGETSTANTSTW